MRAKTHIKKEDRVVILAGRDKGKIGKVIKVMPEKQRALIEKINVVKRHTRPDQKGQGGIVEKEAPIHISNLAVICASCTDPTRVGRRMLDDGRRVRYCKKCGEQIDS